MKHVTLSIFSALFFSTVGFGQELVMVNDTINKFQIGVPVGWRYGIPKDNSVTFMALRQKTNESDKPRENFNINILHHKEVDFNESYTQFIASIGKTDGFRIIEQKDKVIGDRKYKYLLETHKNHVSQEEMTAYILFTNDNGEVLMLTMVTTTENINRYLLLFDRIAASLKY